MLPSAPANLGTYHFFGVLALGLVGTDATRAAACIIVFHALDVVTALAFGAVCLAAVRAPVWSFLPRARGTPRSLPS
jgi:uncharacterized membrane protein YbhN (UPF0104 family)